MKVYIVSVDGNEIGLTRAANMNAAEKKMQKKYPGNAPSGIPRVTVSYTEIGPEEEKKVKWL